MQNYLILLIIILIGEYSSQFKKKFLFELSENIDGFTAKSNFNKTILYLKYGYPINSFISKYSVDGNFLSNETTHIVKAEYYNLNEYVTLENYYEGIMQNNIYLNYYVHNNLIYSEKFMGYIDADFLILKDKSLIIFVTLEGNGYRLYKYDYPPIKTINEEIKYESNIRSYFKIMICSDKILIFFIKDYYLFVKIYDIFLNYITYYQLFQEQCYNFYVINSDEINNNIIICIDFGINKVKGLICYHLKYENKLIFSNSLNIFPEFFNHKFDMILLEKNKIAAVYCTLTRIFFSTFIYDGNELKFDSFKNKVLIEDYSFQYPALISNENNDLILYMTTRDSNTYVTKVYEVNLFQYCKNILIDNVIPYKRHLINFTNYFNNGIDKKIDELFIYINDLSINIYKNDEKVHYKTTFTMNDKIYIECKEDREKEFILFYGFNNKKCRIILNTIKRLIKVEDKYHICLLNSDIEEINNVQSIDLKQKISNNNFNDNFYDLNIKYEKDIRNIDLNYYYLNAKLDCQKKDKKNVNCKVISPKIVSQDKYICSKLSCSNMMKLKQIKDKDDYIINIYDAKNITHVSTNINIKYNPEETITNFNVDMISYYLWFSSFGYCDNTVISSGKCCKAQILKNWKVLKYKEYTEKLKDWDIYNMFKEELDRLGLLENENRYIYNFAILRSDVYKKFIICFPGTTKLFQLIDEITQNNFESFLQSRDIKVQKYFYYVFKLIYKDIFSVDIINELNMNKDYQIIFTGHSLGGALATLISYYYSKNDLSINEPVLITFGQPRVGNVNFAKDYMEKIKKVFRVAREDDLVTKIPLNKKYDIKIGELFLEFVNQKIDDIVTKNKKSFFILQPLIKTIALKIISKINTTVGYCHIGGLYLLKDNRFYHCSDFYNEDTGHPICRNLGLDKKISFDFKYHNYLNVKDEILRKCQNDKLFNLF